MPDLRPIRAQVKKASLGGWYLLLIAANGEITMTSEIYTRRSEAYRAFEFLRTIPKVGLTLVLAKPTRKTTKTRRPGGPK